MDELNAAVAALNMKTAELNKRNEELEKALKQKEVEKKSEFYMIAQVLIEHCYHLGITEEVLENIREAFMKRGYRGIYDCLVQLNEGCIEDEPCEECATILQDFKTGES